MHLVRSSRRRTEGQTLRKRIPRVGRPERVLLGLLAFAAVHVTENDHALAAHGEVWEGERLSLRNGEQRLQTSQSQSNSPNGLEGRGGDVKKKDIDDEILDDFERNWTPLSRELYNVSHNESFALPLDRARENISFNRAADKNYRRSRYCSNIDFEDYRPRSKGRPKPLPRSLFRTLPSLPVLRELPPPAIQAHDLANSKHHEDRPTRVTHSDLAYELLEAHQKSKMGEKFQSFFGHLNLDKETIPSLVGRLESVSNLLSDLCPSDSHSDSDSDSDRDASYRLHQSWPDWATGDSELLKRQTIKFAYEQLMEQFDMGGLRSMLDAVMGAEERSRFTQAMERFASATPHCDGANGPPAAISMTGGNGVKFPGGPFRLDFGFNVAQMISKNVMEQAQKAAAQGQVKSPVGQLMSMMAVMSVVSIVETVVATVIDIVPPMIPPPFWILWSLPCLPMLTGANCLFSVLYPISLSDFMMAPTTDMGLNGLITSFPQEYRQRVGKGSAAAYKLCATAYFGMQCAALFPLCWIPMGLRTSMSFPMCFIHCLLTLVACPGFWIDQIINECTVVAAPPLCSFSLFINHARIPPQYVSFGDSHPYPSICPPKDADLDADFDDAKHALEGALAARPPAVNETGGPGAIAVSRTLGDSVFAKISDYDNLLAPQPLICDCDRLCQLRDGDSDGVGEGDGVGNLDCVHPMCQQVCSIHHARLKTKEALDKKEAAEAEKKREKTMAAPVLEPATVGHIIHVHSPT